MEIQLINLLMIMVPTLVTGAIAYLFFKEHIENENKRRNFLITKELQKETLPIRLQAYERMSLFLERIAAANLLTRISPQSASKEDYSTLLIATIEQEYEHNLSQQIYVSDQCWGVITAAKNATIQLIRTSSLNTKATSADGLRELILTELLNKTSPSHTALSYIKKEVSELW